jgi:hypothetical protein
VAGQKVESQEVKGSETGRDTSFWCNERREQQLRGQKVVVGLITHLDSNTMRHSRAVRATLGRDSIVVDRNINHGGHQVADLVAKRSRRLTCRAQRARVWFVIRGRFALYSLLNAWKCRVIYTRPCMHDE